MFSSSAAIIAAICTSYVTTSCGGFGLPPRHIIHRSRRNGNGRYIGSDSKLMGIKGFRSWFESTFPSAVVTISPEPFNIKTKSGKSIHINGSSDGKGVQPERFDHVLIDANQFLHTTLRKAYNRRLSRSKGGANTIENEQQQMDDDMVEHCLLLFLKELNRITTTTAIPKKSLVIALDGSPGAAKLEMQRGRRYSIYKKAESQERQIEVLRERGWRDNDFGFFTTSKSRRKGHNSIFTKHERERVTLNITPGTRFMDSVTDALLYWSWKYVSRRSHRVRVSLSPSSVHGEGEVKLLDWIMRGQDGSDHRPNIKQNETVAILGGDSDLVLMGLVVPPSITHNVHVILPGERGKSLVVSVWETTRVMARMIEGTATYGKPKKRSRKRKRTLTLSQINQARIDTALLIIMNGNDYLPKLRGCRDFDSAFEVYLDLVQKWMDVEGNGDGESFLINLDDDNELYLNVPFALAFFEALASKFPTASYKFSSEDSLSSGSLLGTLINLSEAKILPGPCKFDTISGDDSFFQQELWEMNAKLNQDTTSVIKEVFSDGAEIVRLTLGDFPSDYVASSNTANAGREGVFTTVLGEADGHGVISRMIRSENCTKAGGRAYLFEVPHKKQYSTIKAAKHRLACLALEEIFGRDNVGVLFGDGYSDDNEDDSSDKFQGLAKADAACYLGGLLWNLETYRHGGCADYGYDYGMRASPAPFELAAFLKDLKRQGKLKVSFDDLVTRTQTAPLSDGLSCLAAVPPQAWHVVPEPYSQLIEPSRSKDFEDLYTSCFHPETNAFDVQLFEQKCNAELSRIGSQQNSWAPASVPEDGDPGEKSSEGRRIYTGSNFWTVLSRSNIPLVHPFEPPAPFADRVTLLRKNKKIRATKLPVKTKAEKPKPTTGVSANVNGVSERERSDEGGDQRVQSVHEIPFRTAFRNRNLQS